MCIRKGIGAMKYNKYFFKNNLKILGFSQGLIPGTKIETRLIGSILISLILLEQETEAKACGIQKEGAS